MGDRAGGKTAIVTGAGSVGPGIGNGKAAAILFAREGARVVAVDTNRAAAEETKRLIEEEGGTCFTTRADVSVASDCERVARECVSEYGRIDILHNNVGIEIPGGILEITEDDWDRTLDVNLKSVFLMCRAVLPHMVDQGGGSIVNISSINGIRTLPALSGPYGGVEARHGGPHPRDRRRVRPEGHSMQRGAARNDAYPVRRGLADRGLGAAMSMR